ncbi:MAG TPA: hypothetical protein VIM16_13075 [Mucilaginibacter sp.]
MGAFRAQQSMQFASQQMQTMMRMMNMRGVTGTGDEFDFVVVLLDSTRMKITSAMYTDSATKKRFILLVDKKYSKSDTNRYKRIYPSQTLYLKRDVARDDESAASLYYRGKPADSCWMFKVIAGTINVYSFLSDRDFANFETSSIVGMQLNDGPIMKYSDDSLKQMIDQDSDAMRYFQKKKYLKAIRRYNYDTWKAAKK